MTDGRESREDDPHAQDAGFVKSRAGAGEGAGHWHHVNEELHGEQARGLGCFVYVSMFSGLHPAVTRDLYEAHRDHAVSVDEEFEEFIDWPAGVYVDAFSARYGMAAAAMRRLCEAASRELAGKVLTGIESARARRTAAWDASIWRLHDQHRRENGLPSRDELLDSAAVTAEAIHQQGLAALRGDHFAMLRQANDLGIDLGVPFPR